MSRMRTEQLTTSCEDAISVFLGDIESLAVECREVVDNAPESLQSSPRISTLSETADTLENIRTPDAPENALDGINDAVTVYVSYKYGKRRGQESRATRRDNAVNHLDAAITHIRDVCDKLEGELDEGAKADEENKGEVEALSEGARALTATMRDELEALIQEWRDYADELESAKDEAEGVEFPGMMG